MTEYTAHIQVPDAAIGAVLHDIMLGFEETTCATLRSGNGTWLSVGFHAEGDDHATFQTGTMRYAVSQIRGVEVPEGYAEDCLKEFENQPMVVCQGRTVVYSEGI